jgi:hypothetical protein
MASSGILRSVAGTDVSEELRASFIGVTRMGELGKLAVTSNSDYYTTESVWIVNSNNTSIVLK